MNSASDFARRLARLGLLIAAVLHFAGTAAGPSAHLAAAAPVTGDAADQGGGEAPAQPQPHNELNCALCHSLVSVVVPAGGMGVPEPLLAGEAGLPERVLLRPAAPPLRPSARAPPVA